MNPEEYGRMHELETHYWWFVGRRAIIRQQLQEIRNTDLAARPLELLDIGCGTGANLPMLSEVAGSSGFVTALDYSPLALQFAAHEMNKQSEQKRSIALLRGDATRLPFADNHFDVVTMLDVLEHVEDDLAAVSEIHRVLKPGGAFVLSVPAYQKLWSAHDEALHHFRRYEYHDLQSVLRQGGLQVRRISFAMSIMPPIAWFWRRFILPFKPRRSRNASRHSEGAVLPTVPNFVNRLLVKYLETEGAIIRRRPLQFGTSLVAIARKSSEK
jgi:ubiquinone/menaquinone biosynthesis C-methylase UbiE